MRLLSLLKFTAIAALVAFALPVPAHAQTAVAAGVIGFVGPLLLNLVLPVLGTVAASAIAWIIAKEALGFGLLKAKAKSQAQRDAIDQLQFLTQHATESVLSTVTTDLVAKKSAGDVAADALKALKDAVPFDQLVKLGKAAAGVGVDELEYFLTHLLTAKAAPAVSVAQYRAASSALQAVNPSGAQGKVLSAPEGFTAGHTLSEIRNEVKKQGTPITE